MLNIECKANIPLTIENEIKPIYPMTRGGILGVRCREHLLISTSTLPRLGRVSAKNVNKLTDFNAAFSSLAHDESSC